MILHKDREIFDTLVKQVASTNNIDEATVKKDYYVTLLLKDIVKNNDNIIFKGGTSLSKAWHAINRFSEDIDLTCEEHPTVGERRQISHDIVDIIKSNNMKLVNEDEIKSKVDYNAYEIDYGDEKSEYLKENILIETTYILGSFPSETKEVATYIYDYLKENNQMDIIKEYQLEPFELRVQSLERTFIDKVFALCDYEMRKSYDRNSRHIYDLYKLYPKVKLDNDFKKLLENVRLLRRTKRLCVSAEQGVNINEVLMNIKNSNDFKNDYENTTSKMFYAGEDLKYEEAITVIDKIIESNLFLEKESIKDMIKDVKEKSEKQVIKNVIKNKDLML